MVRHQNGVEMNGHGRKTKTADIALAPIRLEKQIFVFNYLNYFQSAIINLAQKSL